MSALLPAGVDGRGLKIRFGELIDRAGGLEAAAGFCRPGKSTLHRYQSTAAADAECFAPIDVVRDLERLVGAPIVTHFLASEADHVLIAKPRLSAVATGDVHAAIARCVRECGEAQSTTLMAMADQKLSHAEAVEALREIDDAIESKLMLRALLVQLRDDDG